jgi:hypothetical protein
MHGSLDFHPFQAFANAANNAHSLSELVVRLQGDTFPRDPSGLTALASAFREHTALQDFRWIDFCPLLRAAQNTALDPVLRALPMCPHLRIVVIKTKCASTDAINNLLQLRPTTDLKLVLEPDQWLAMADEIRRGRFHVLTLYLAMIPVTISEATAALLPVTISEATEAVQAVASAIRRDRHLKQLHLQMENGFTDEAGVALAEVLTVNKTLRLLRLSTTVHYGRNMQNSATLGAQSYEAFSAMLRVNTSVVLVLPPFETDGADERLLESRDQMRIEQRLNEVGRGGLLASSSQTTREEWVDALHELSSNEVDESDAFRVSCLFSLLRLHPDVCMLHLNDTTTTGL